MIRYPITKDALLARIRREKSGWLAEAATITAVFHLGGTYQEPPQPFWGQIKPVYMRLQKNKCAFCERKLTPRTKDHDIEHFRPKRAVAAWPPLPTDSAFPEGYYLLAYNPLNYTASCEHCNRGLKKSYFPIAGTRISGQTDPALLTPEQPLLIYPLGDMDTDPEELIGFQGIFPIPKHTGPNTYAYQRAAVTIQFFDLQAREELRRERAMIIESLHLALLHSDTAPSPQQRHHFQAIVQRIQSSGSPHANCARCFYALYQQNPQQAKRLAKLATQLLEKLVR